MKRLFLVLSLLPLSSFVYAQENKTPLTLEEALSRARTSHPRIAEQDATIESTKRSKTQLELTKKPQVDATLAAGATPLLFEVQANDGASLFSLGYRASVDASLLLSDFGKLSYNLLSVSSQIDAAEKERNATQLALSKEVVSAYYALWLAEQRVVLLQKLLTESEQRVETAKAFVSAGARPKIEISRAELDKAKAKADLQSALEDVNRQEIRLAAAIGQKAPRGTNYATTSISEQDLLKTEPNTEAYLAQQPDLIALEALREAQQQRIKGVKITNRPNLFAQSSLDISGRGGDTLFLPIFSAQLVFSMPLYDAGRANTEAILAQTELSKLDAQIGALRLQLQSQFETALVTYREANVRYEASQDTLRFAQENLTLAQERYKAGAGSAIEISDAQVQFARASLDELQARSDKAVSQFLLLLITGQR